MKLFIGNKNYSSWSYRVWLAMRVKDIVFEENLRPFDVENNYKDYFEFSPSGKVPVLVDQRQTVWESLAILEYLADKFPDKHLWPAESNLAAHARCIATEMHAGFTALRAACPMNMRRTPSQLDVSAATLKDVLRIETIWDSCLERSNGPFLFGDFCIADAMFAPVVNRLQVYQLSSAESVQKYTQVMTELSAWKEWAVAAKAESWIVDIDEV